jgi:hypothetical protein
MQISKGAIAFMMESSRMFTITDWAWNSKKKHEHRLKSSLAAYRSTASTALAIPMSASR